MALIRKSIGNLNGIAFGGGDMAQMTDIEKTDAASTQPRVSRLWHTLADISLMACSTLAAIPFAKFEIGDGLLIMIVVFYASLISVVGLRDYAATLLGVNVTADEPPDWLGPAKSVVAVAIFITSLLGATWAISWLSVSGQNRMILLFGAITVMWILMRCLGRVFLAEKPTVPNAAGPTMMEGRN